MAIIGTPTGISYYTTPRRIWQYLGSLKTILNESLGISDGTANQSFQTANPFLMENQQKVYVGSEQWSRVVDFLSSGASDKHYKLDYDTGIVTFGDGLNGKIPPLNDTIKIFYEYGSKSNDEMNNYISWATDLIEDKTETCFRVKTVSDEIYEMNQVNSWQSPESLSTISTSTRQDFGITNFSNDRIRLRNSPIIKINKLEINGADASSTDSWTQLTENTGSGGDFILDEQNKEDGYITFLTSFPRYGRRSIRVGYDWGTTTVPPLVEELATLLVVKKLISSSAVNSAIAAPVSIEIDGLSVARGNSSLSTSKMLDNDINKLWETIGTFTYTIHR